MKIKIIISAVAFLLLFIAAIKFDWIMQGASLSCCQDETADIAVVEKKRSTLSFQTAKGDTIDLDYYKGSYLIVDCWITTCGVCIEKFPDLQKLHDSYKDNPNVKICALHLRKEDKEETCKTGADIVQSKGFNFPCYSISNGDSKLRRMITIKRFPTVVVYSPDGDLVYNGNSLEDAVNFTTEKVDLI